MSIEFQENKAKPDLSKEAQDLLQIFSAKNPITTLAALIKERGDVSWSSPMIARYLHNLDAHSASRKSEARTKLTWYVLPEISHVVNSYQGRGLPDTDLMQEAYVTVQEHFQKTKETNPRPSAQNLRRSVFLHLMKHFQGLQNTVEFEQPTNNLGVASLQQNPEDLVVTREVLQELSARLQMLSQQKQQIIMMRYGLSDGDTHSQQEVSQNLHLAPQAIKQEEEKALNLLRKQYHLPSLKTRDESAKTTLSGQVNNVHKEKAPAKRSSERPSAFSWSNHDFYQYLVVGRSTQYFPEYERFPQEIDLSKNWHSWFDWMREKLNDRHSPYAVFGKTPNDPKIKFSYQYEQPVDEMSNKKVLDMQIALAKKSGISVMGELHGHRTKRSIKLGPLTLIEEKVIETPSTADLYRFHSDPNQAPTMMIVCGQKNFLLLRTHNTLSINKRGSLTSLADFEHYWYSRHKLKPPATSLLQILREVKERSPSSSNEYLMAIDIARSMKSVLYEGKPNKNFVRVWP